MSQLNDIHAGGIDPLRDHRPDAPVHLRSVRFASRVVEAQRSGLVSIVDGTQDTLGDINCAGFWPKVTRSISGWAFAWPAVVARGHIPSRGGGGGGGQPPSTPTVVVTPDPHGPGAGVVYSRSGGVDSIGTTAQSNARTLSTETGGGGGPRAFRPSISMDVGVQGQNPQSRSISTSPTRNSNTGGSQPPVSHWQDTILPPRGAVAPEATCFHAGAGYAGNGGGENNSFHIYEAMSGRSGTLRVGQDTNIGAVIVQGADPSGRWETWASRRANGILEPRWYGARAYAPSNRGGTWVVGVQGARNAYGARFDNWEGNGVRGGSWNQRGGTAYAPRNRGGTWQAGVRGSRRAWGIRFGGW